MPRVRAVKCIAHLAYKVRVPLLHLRGVRRLAGAPLLWKCFEHLLSAGQAASAAEPQPKVQVANRGDDRHPQHQLQEQHGGGGGVRTGLWRALRRQVPAPLASARLP